VYVPPLVPPISMMLSPSGTVPPLGMAWYCWRFGSKRYAAKVPPFTWSVASPSAHGLPVCVHPEFEYDPLLEAFPLPAKVTVAGEGK
jgi:hypothetical protein